MRVMRVSLLPWQKATWCQEGGKAKGLTSSYHGNDDDHCNEPGFAPVLSPELDECVLLLWLGARARWSQRQGAISCGIAVLVVPGGQLIVHFRADLRGHVVGLTVACRYLYRPNK